MKDITVVFGEIIRQRRKEKRMTMKQLSEKVNVAESTICRYERGEREMSLQNFFDICDALDLEPNDVQKMLTPYLEKSK